MPRPPDRVHHARGGRGRGGSPGHPGPQHLKDGALGTGPQTGALVETKRAVGLGAHPQPAAVEAAVQLRHRRVVRSNVQPIQAAIAVGVAAPLRRIISAPQRRGSSASPSAAGSSSATAGSGRARRRWHMATAR